MTWDGIAFLGILVTVKTYLHNLRNELYLMKTKLYMIHDDVNTLQVYLCLGKILSGNRLLGQKERSCHASHPTEINIRSWQTRDLQNKTLIMTMIHRHVISPSWLSFLVDNEKKQ